MPQQHYWWPCLPKPCPFIWTATRKNFRVPVPISDDLDVGQIVWSQTSQSRQIPHECTFSWTWMLPSWQLSSAITIMTLDASCSFASLLKANKHKQDHECRSAIFTREGETPCNGTNVMTYFLKTNSSVYSYGAALPSVPWDIKNSLLAKANVCSQKYPNYFNSVRLNFANWFICVLPKWEFCKISKINILDCALSFLWFFLLFVCLFLSFFLFFQVMAHKCLKKA